jgi:hypothetical protein
MLSPRRLIPERQVFDSKPDAIDNAFAAVFSIPQDETIRQDLEAVLGRRVARRRAASEGVVPRRATSRRVDLLRKP